jgi:hypothetical protein
VVVIDDQDDAFMGSHGLGVLRFDTEPSSPASGAVEVRIVTLLPDTAANLLTALCRSRPAGPFRSDMPSPTALAKNSK